MKTNPFALLPEVVMVNGAEYSIDGDFRTMVTMEMELSGEQADIWGVLDSFYCHNIPGDVEQATRAMIAFYEQWDEVETAEDQEESKKTENSYGKKCYDFLQDADALTASFQQAYNIDLETARVHWWKFRRLMFGLPLETPFMQRVHYRTADLSKVDKSKRKYYRKMKQLYALKQPNKKKKTNITERDNKIRERLLARFAEAKERLQKETG